MGVRKRGDVAERRATHSGAMPCYYVHSSPLTAATVLWGVGASGEVGQPQGASSSEDVRANLLGNGGGDSGGEKKTNGRGSKRYR